MLQHFNTELSYTLVRSSRRKRLALQIKNGELYVRATPFCCQSQINAFIRLKLGWIHQQLYRQQQQLQHVKSEVTAQELRLLDQRVPLQKLVASKSGYVFDGEQLKVFCSHRVRSERQQLTYQQQIELWYQQQAIAWMGPRLDYWQERMQLRYRRFFVKAWRRRWGCCNSEQALGFNWHLIKAPGWVIDYVLVHELAHLKWMDHSADFWQLVRSHYPDVEAARHWLQQHQLWLLN